MRWRWMAMVAAMLVLAGVARAGQPGMVGGPCHYVAVSGVARIVSVQPADQGYDVRFVFESEEVPPGAEEGIGAAGTFALKREANGRLANPDEQVVYSHTMREGARIPVTYEYIELGTCTPFIWSFHTLPPGFTAARP